MTTRVSSLLALLLTASLARADFPTTHPYSAITYGHEARSNPPMKLYWVEVDLAGGKAAVRVSRGGADPDGPGKYQTTLMCPSEVATREGFDITVNGDFFEVKEVKDAPGGLSRYFAGQWARVLGPAVTDGQVWADAPTRRPCLVITRQGKAQISLLDRPTQDAVQAVAGNQMLIADGKAVAQTNADRHPRTVAGTNKAGDKLVLLVVDGRKSWASIGMTYAELAGEMLKLGCYTALNLDGGGSTVLVMRDPADGACRILNSPSDLRERPVANVLGITVKDKPATRQGP